MARTKKTQRTTGPTFRSLSKPGTPTTSHSNSVSSSAAPSRHESPFASHRDDSTPAASTSRPNPDSYNRPRVSTDSETGSMKRSLSNDGDTPGTAAGGKRTKRRPKKGKGKAAEPAPVGQEDGEIDEFEGLFMIDVAPSAIKEEVLADPNDELSSKELQAQSEALQQSVLEKEEQEMRAFQQEVADSDASDDDDEDDDDETRVVVAVYDDPDALQKGIQAKIQDDSAAKISGRYYKEVDLTRSCGLCGEQGHTSRECTHAQCFTCGLVDGDHEARNCPVSLVCSACGSRGHFARDCSIPNASRSAYGARCSTCSSNLHLVSNCPSLWRVYDLTGAKPSKHTVVFACGNDGSTGNHFIDDCLLPRMHPMRFADPSAFNSAALSDPRYAGTSSQHPRGGASGTASSARRRGAPSQPFEEEPADDDWFASRGASRSSSRGGSKNASSSSRRGNDSYGDFDAPTPPPSRGGGHRSAGRPQKGSYNGLDESRRSGSGGSSSHHIHFDGGLERFGDSPGGSRGGKFQDRDRGGYDSPKDLPYGRSSGSGSKGKASYSGRKEESSRREDRRDDKGRRDGSSRQPDPPRGATLSSRLGPGPSYKGGYY